MNDDEDYVITIRLGIKAPSIEVARARAEQMFRNIDTWRYKHPQVFVEKA